MLNLEPDSYDFFFLVDNCKLLVSFLFHDKLIFLGSDKVHHSAYLSLCVHIVAAVHLGSLSYGKDTRSA